ncbi:hypothetical protein EDB86DRAFT_3249920 [Lactarius hatsudake]|nr:hypothetical protein EDB86DRAFT_3249920 [Lactarius hatsudake]
MSKAVRGARRESNVSGPGKANDTEVSGSDGEGEKTGRGSKSSGLDDTGGLELLLGRRRLGFLAAVANLRRRLGLFFWLGLGYSSWLGLGRGELVRARVETGKRPRPPEATEEIVRSSRMDKGGGLRGINTTPPHWGSQFVRSQVRRRDEVTTNDLSRSARAAGLTRTEITLRRDDKGETRKLDWYFRAKDESYYPGLVGRDEGGIGRRNETERRVDRDEKGKVKGSDNNSQRGPRHDDARQYDSYYGERNGPRGL